MFTLGDLTSGVDTVRQRFGFLLPRDYLRIWKSGLLDQSHSDSLRISRVHWFSPDEIAAIKWWPPYKIKSLIPCAQTIGRGHFGWCIAKGRTPFIAECPRDSDFAEGFAPNFEGCVFRSLLVEFSDTWLVEDDLTAASKKFSHDADLASNMIRPKWASILNRYAKRPAFISEESGNPCVISPAEVTMVVKHEFKFRMLDKDFLQHER